MQVLQTILCPILLLEAPYFAHKNSRVIRLVQSCEIDFVQVS